jgi:hypothetical protein
VSTLAWAVASVHLLCIVLMLGGGLLGLRWPAVLPVWALAAGSILAVNLAGADCPLTDLEQWLRERAGEPAYGGGFISHYLVEPWHPEGVTPAVSRGIYAVALTPNVLAAVLWARRGLARRRAAQAVA